MKQRRIHIPGPVAPGPGVVLNEETSHYVRRVLRLSVGDALTVFDGTGGEHTATIHRSDGHAVELRVSGYREPPVESPLKVWLMPGLCKGERMDLAIQKAAELGVHAVLPLSMAFSVVKLNEARALRRQTHWQAIARSACEQCGRTRLPVIHAPQTLQSALRQLPEGATKLVLTPGTTNSMATAAAPGREGVVILVGPEGGLSGSEQDEALAAAFQPVRLGPRTLRAETASVAGVALAQSLWGDLA